MSIVNPFTINDASSLKAFKTQLITILVLWNNEKQSEELISTIRNRIGCRLFLLKANNSCLCLSKLIKEVTLDSFLSGILNISANEDLLAELPDLIIQLWKNNQAQGHLRKLLLTYKDDFSQSETWQKIKSGAHNKPNRPTAKFQ